MDDSFPQFAMYLSREEVQWLEDILTVSNDRIKDEVGKNAAEFAAEISRGLRGFLAFDPENE